MKIKFIIALAVTVSLVSCNKNECEDPIIPGCMDVTSENYNPKANKEDGTCTYPIDPIDKFIGKYTIDQTCYYEDDMSFTIDIVKGPNSSEILIKNFANERDIRAKVEGGDISFKEEQEGIVYEGTGYIVGKEITINYEACEAYYYPCSSPESCKMAGSK